ncbi:MAG: C25 family cysteine peptidase [Bacteroidota bacterium]
MKKHILAIIILAFGFVDGVFSQPLGNEWISYSQSYYKVYVHENGIYRIGYNALLNAGVPLGSIDARSIQVFNRGVEQYIFVKGENDGMLNSGDYIEFYGERNDGKLDTVLYKSTARQPNRDYSLFSDSAAYFITWNSSITNRRMISETDINFSTYTPVSYIYKTSRQNYTSKYFAGETNSVGMTDPDYTPYEGWFDNDFNLGQSTTKNIATANKYASGPAAIAEFVVVGASNYAVLSPDHHLRIQFAGNTIDTIYEGYKTLRFNYSLPIAQLGTTTSAFTFSSINDLGSGSDRNTVAYIQIKYAHTLHLENQTSFWFLAGDAIQAKSLFSFSGFSANAGDTNRLYDITNHRRVKVVYDGTLYKCLLPNSGNEKSCLLTSDGQVGNITQVYPVSADAKFVNYESIANLELSDYFIITHKTLWAEAENYKTYRNSTGYHAMTVDVDHLYDQFAYGVLKSPLAIKNFVRFGYFNFAVAPKDVFLIGKAYRAATDGSYPCYRNNAYYNALTLVPSYGYPPSDQLFSQGILDTLYQPAVATGRLSARTPDQVTLYLNKVIQYEQAQMYPQEWMKTILHFGGGTTSSEQSTFSSYLSNYREIIEDTLFGGDVKTFLKTSSAPIQINQSDSLRTLINNGVSMMTFFGHAAGIGFDESCDNPSEYNNTGKYPFMLANSCYAGDIFLAGNSSSEEFVLIENKGAIGYLASISLGLPWALNLYSNELHKNISYKSYGKPIGEIIKKTIGYIQIPDLTTKETCLAMTLHGDPAIILNSFSKPDYTIGAQGVFFNPQNVTSEQDSFNIAIIPTNIGRAIVDSFVIQTIRTFPDGTTTSTYLTKVAAPYFKDTVYLKLPVSLALGLGLNKFKITLDFYNEIDELSELNNSTEVTLFIKSADIIPIYPIKYAVIPTLPVTLKASTGFAFLDAFDYEFQLDTTDAFTSPIKQEGHVNHAGGVVSWSPTFPISTDSIVYFWRVSIDSNGDHNYNWRESSFQYITGKSGWGQAHFFQFKNDGYEYVKYNKPQRKFEFVNSLISLSCQTGVYPYIPWNEEWYKLNNVVTSLWSYLGDVGNGVVVAVFDSVSSLPWRNTAYTSLQYGFDFSTVDSIGRLGLYNMLNSIPLNDKVLVYSHRNHFAQNFNNALYTQFESIGSANIRTLQNNIPYIIFGKKGSTIATAHELEGTSISSIIKLEDSLITKWNKGYMESEIIGPASNWSSLHWKSRYLEPSVPDSIRLNVVGIKQNGDMVTLIANLPPDSADIFNLNTRINAAIYPYIKLVAAMRDDSLHTPPQMRRWQVLFDGVPETALDPSLHFIFHSDTIQEGDKILLSTATHNISNYSMDSLLIKYWIVDKNHVTHPLGTFRHRPHPAGDILVDTISSSTVGLGGYNSIWIEVNPDNDQLEQTHFNNIGEMSFYVAADKINPLLDVTFDGVHILDGDIVSAKPEIQISLKDENKFLALNDTSSFRVYLINPGNTTMNRVHFMSGGQEILQFIPASLPNNSCKILFKADFPTDGVYKFIVEAQDVSRNASGSNNFGVSFEVINKPSITHVMNWPNPFTTATHFVFTITGSEIPTYFKIQIMTVTGKVVREIDLSELGAMHIGRNITDYAWDGTDEYGDRLANGVYLYRVVTRLNGNTIELKETGADPYFKKEFGKMYLLGN